MGSLVLFIGISLVVLLYARADVLDVDSPEHAGICERCNDASLPQCQTADPSQFSEIITCADGAEQACVVGVVLQHGDEHNSADTMCRIDSQGVSADIAPPTMPPLPLAAQSGTTEAAVDAVADNVVAANAVNEDANVSEPATADEAKLTANEALPDAAADMDKDSAENVAASPVESSPTAAEETEATAEGDKPVEESTAAAVAASEIAATAESPLESMDYQADAPDDADKLAAAGAGAGAGDNIDAHATVPTEAAIEQNALQPVDAASHTDSDDGAAEQNQAQEADHETDSPASGATESVVQAEQVTVRVPADFQSCYECSSASDAQCAAQPTRQINCKAAEGTGNGCYTLLKAQRIERGCTSALGAAQFAACADDERRECVLCAGSNCNNASWPQCYACASRESEPSCAQWPESSSVAQLATFCTGWDDVCISRVDATGATVRGCVSRDTGCGGSAAARMCQLCSGALCNGGIFPAGRRQCHQCSGTAACADSQSAAGALPCATYHPNDSCFFYVNVEGQMQRGCCSSSVLFAQCLASDSGRCRTCADADACNALPLMAVPTLSCSHCDSRRLQDGAVATGCAWAQSTETVAACSKRYLYYLNESCQTFYQPDMELAVRGCSLDTGACERSNEWCRACSTDACNSDNMRWEHCVQCSSDEVAGCGGDALGVPSTKCAAEVQPYALRGCYTSRSVDTNTTTRGCISDLTEEGLKYCKKSPKLCTLCYDSGCNNQQAPSSARRYKSLLSAVLLFAAIGALTVI